MKKDKKKNKLLIILAIAIFAVALFAVGIWFLLPKDEEIKSNGEYYPANYEENIFLNQAYMEFRRDLIYSIGGVDQLFSYEKDFESAEVE